MHCYTNTALTQVRGRVLLLGDSITDDGRYVAYLNTWLRLFAPAQEVTLYNLGVSGETISGLSEPDHPYPRPCVQGRLARALEQIKPDWVVICYGMNDGIYHPFAQARLDAYLDGYETALQAVRAAGASIVLCTPPPFDTVSYEAAGHRLERENAPSFGYLHAYEGYDAVLHRYGEALCERFAAQVELMVDLYTPLRQDLDAARATAHTEYGDGIHPGLHGHWLIAKTLLEALFGVHTAYGEQLLAQGGGALYNCMRQRSDLLHAYWKERVGHDNPDKASALPEEELHDAVTAQEQELDRLCAAHPEWLTLRTQWEGQALEVFCIDGFEALVLCPHAAAPGAPWLWRTEFFGQFAAVDLAMLQQGWHVVHVSIPHLFGSPLAVAYMQRFYAVLRARYALAQRVALMGLSRGGLYALHYAAAAPETVLALYLDAPVVDIHSWPAGGGVGGGSPQDWQRCKLAFGQEAQPEAFWARVQRAACTLVQAGIPLLVVAGDADDVVPYLENAARLLELYRQAGGQAQCIVKPGVGHHPHSLAPPTSIVEFLQRAAQTAGGAGQAESGS